MKRVIAITAFGLMAYAASAAAQSSAAQNQPLAEVAKTEEARRKSIKRPAKIYTNDSLRAVDGSPAPLGTSSMPSGGAGGTVAAPDAPPAEAAPDQSAPGEKKDRAYWEGRIKAARDQVSRSQMFADSLQSRINALLTDFVNRDDPAQRAKIEADRVAALAELERVRKEIAEQNKAVQAIEDEARRAGVPAGWLRPGA